MGCFGNNSLTMNESSGWFGVSQLVVHGLINAGSPNSSHPYGIVPTVRSGCGGGGSVQLLQALHAVVGTTGQSASAKAANCIFVKS
jgi:hypothetical protein